MAWDPTKVIGVRSPDKQDYYLYHKDTGELLATRQGLTRFLGSTLYAGFGKPVDEVDMSSPSILRGEMMHDAMEEYFKTGRIPTDPQLQQAVKYLKQRYPTDKGWALKSEYVLASPDPNIPYASAADVIAVNEKTKEFDIIDFKTGLNKPGPEYKYQVNLYSNWFAAANPGYTPRGLDIMWMPPSGDFHIVPQKRQVDADKIFRQAGLGFTPVKQEAKELSVYTEPRTFPGFKSTTGFKDYPTIAIIDTETTGLNKSRTAADILTASLVIPQFSTEKNEKGQITGTPLLAPDSIWNFAWYPPERGSRSRAEAAEAQAVHKLDNTVIKQMREATEQKWKQLYPNIPYPKALRNKYYNAQDFLEFFNSFEPLQRIKFLGGYNHEVFDMNMLFGEGWAKKIKYNTLDLLPLMRRLNPHTDLLQYIPDQVDTENLSKHYREKATAGEIGFNILARTFISNKLGAQYKKTFGESFSGAHGSIYDAAATARLFTAVFNEVSTDDPSHAFYNRVIGDLVFETPVGGQTVNDALEQVSDMVKGTPDNENNSVTEYDENNPNNKPVDTSAFSKGAPPLARGFAKAKKYWQEREAKQLAKGEAKQREFDLQQEAKAEAKARREAENNKEEQLIPYFDQDNTLNDFFAFKYKETARTDEIFKLLNIPNHIKNGHRFAKEYPPNQESGQYGGADTGGVLNILDYTTDLLKESRGTGGFNNVQKAWLLAVQEVADAFQASLPTDMMDTYLKSPNARVITDLPFGGLGSWMPAKLIAYAIGTTALAKQRWFVDHEAADKDDERLKNIFYRYSGTDIDFDKQQVIKDIIKKKFPGLSGQVVFGGKKAEVAIDDLEKMGLTADQGILVDDNTNYIAQGNQAGLKTWLANVDNDGFFQKQTTVANLRVSDDMIPFYEDALQKQGLKTDPRQDPKNYDKILGLGSTPADISKTGAAAAQVATNEVAADRAEKEQKYASHGSDFSGILNTLNELIRQFASMAAGIGANVSESNRLSSGIQEAAQDFHKDSTRNERFRLFQELVQFGGDIDKLQDLYGGTLTPQTVKYLNTKYRYRGIGSYLRQLQDEMYKSTDFGLDPIPREYRKRVKDHRGVSRTLYDDILYRLKTGLSNGDMESVGQAVKDAKEYLSQHGSNAQKEAVQKTTQTLKMFGDAVKEATTLLQTYNQAQKAIYGSHEQGGMRVAGAIGNLPFMKWTSPFATGYQQIFKSRHEKEWASRDIFASTFGDIAGGLFNGLSSGAVTGLAFGNPLAGAVAGGVWNLGTQTVRHLIANPAERTAAANREWYENLAGHINLAAGILNPLAGAASKVIHSLTGLGLKVLKFGDLLSQVGNPLLSITGGSYSAYQRTLSLDRVAGLSAGSSYKATENWGLQSAGLFSSGDVDTKRLVAAARLGVFSKIYDSNPNNWEQNRAFVANHVKSLLTADGVTQAQKDNYMYLLNNVDSTLAPVVQKMILHNVDYDTLQSPSFYGQRRWDFTDNERRRIDRAKMGYAIGLESIDMSKMRLFTSLWEKFGGSAMDRVNEFLHDLVTSIDSFDYDKSKSLTENLKNFWDSLGIDLGLSLESVFRPIEPILARLRATIEWLGGMSINPEKMKAWIKGEGTLADAIDTPLERFENIVLNEKKQAIKDVFKDRMKGMNGWQAYEYFTQHREEYEMLKKEAEASYEWFKTAPAEEREQYLTTILGRRLRYSKGRKWLEENHLLTGARAGLALGKMTTSEAIQQEQLEYYKKDTERMIQEMMQGVIKNIGPAAGTNVGIDLKITTEDKNTGKKEEIERLFSGDMMNSMKDFDQVVGNATVNTRVWAQKRAIDRAMEALQ